MTESSVLDGSLALPLTACGTYVQETNQPWITNTVVIQQHPLIRTVNDFEKSVICSLPYPFENFWNSTFQLDQIYESHSLHLMASSDAHSGSDIFHESSATIFDKSFTRLTIFQLLNGTVYNDIGIKSCIAHNAEVLAENAPVHQITDPEGCFTIHSENSSLKIARTDEGLTAYVEMKNLEMGSSDNFYLTCEVILCKTKCKCSQIDQQTEQSTTVISHKLTKRSTDTSEMFSLQQYEARTRYLKSTVKALMDRIIEQRKPTDKSKIRKRLMRLDDSSIPSEANSFGFHAAITSTEIFSTESVSNEINNIEPHLEDVYDYYDHDDSHHVYNLDDSRQEYDLDDSRHDYKEEPSRITEFSTVDSDMVVVTLPKESKGKGTEIFPEEELQEKGTTVFSDDVASSVNEATEIIKADATSSVFPPIVEVASNHLGSCIPKLRFVIVIVVMGFFMGCLLLVSCGMALYIRKEKKRNKLNDFLLYSIGF
ncbi:unnamed protein product [Larinioides sclopetarius]|uniref:ZP domain-containing protein n=1 Tax=Larinioides sclopetarius TaxID=280406 RepID=A0AAV2AU02_9ARAC